jgi:aminoglycoside 2'-N-acetyltransferase I
MAELRVAHTSALTAADLHDVRALLEDAFPDDLTDQDVEHALGGMHALLREGGALIAHGSVVMRRLLHGGRSLRTGYVEAVAVRSDRRRQGHGGVVMQALEEVVRGAYELGALGASDEGVPFYAGRGWQPWTGTAVVVAPAGSRRTAGEEDGLFVLPVGVVLDPHGDLACDWREGDCLVAGQPTAVSEGGALAPCGAPAVMMRTISARSRSDGSPQSGW